MNHRSILARLIESGLHTPRVQLRRPATEATGAGLDSLRQSVDRHVLLAEIGRDETGVVRRSHDVDLGRDVAMKLLRRSHLESPEVVTRFVEEAQIAGQLQHPGIVSVYELGLREEQRPYYTMRLVEGETLAALFAAREDSAGARRRLLAIFDQVCQTMAYAHAQGVIHCDLRPDNILVGSFGEVQVVSWGLAKVLGHSDADEIPSGRRPAWEGSATAYLAPEQARRATPDERSDVFALGMILCEILTGELPHATNGKAKFADVGERLAACGADRELATLCRACLSVDPADRPRDAGAVAEAVGAHLATVAERAHRSELAAIEQRAEVERRRTRAEEARAAAREHRRRRRQGLVVAAVLLVAVLVGGAGWRAVESAREERARAVALAVDAQLDEAARLEGLRQWAGAVAAAELARELTQAGDASEALRDRAANSLLEVQERWADARETVRRAAETAALVRRLEEVRLLRAEPSRIHDAYARAFRDFGIDLEDLRSAAAQIRLRNGAATLVPALDHWASLRRRHEGLPEPGRLVAIARAADPDRERNEIRAATDPEQLRRLAARADVARTPARTFGLLALLLMEVDDVTAAVKLLREAVAEHPGDLWLNRDLAEAVTRLEAPRREEALRYLTAAAAVRPASAGLWRALGIAQHRAGEYEEATRSLQRAIALSWGGRPGDWMACAAARACSGLQGLRASEENAAPKVDLTPAERKSDTDSSRPAGDR
jgi:serine/threonine-protein kinase